MSVRRRFPVALVAVNLNQLVDEVRVELVEQLHGLADYLDVGEIAVDTDVALTTGQIAAVQAILDAHVARDYSQISADSETTVSNIPNWATWTEAEALAWFDANVTDFDSARTVLRALVRIVLAMRNRLWPNLEGS